MSTRATLGLLAVLLVCVGVAFYVQGPGSADGSREREALIPGLAPADVALIRVARAGSATVLTRVGGAWKVGAAMAPADGAAVEALLAKLAGLRAGPVVSTNPERQTVYEADAGRGIEVRLEGAGGKALASFVIGMRGPDFASCYLRRGQEREVRLVAPDLHVDFMRPPDAWREPPKPAELPKPAPAPAAVKPAK